MNEDKSGSTFTLTIDRLVVDGVPGELAEDRFREQLSAELRRLLARPDVLDSLRGKRVGDGLTRSVDSSELNDPARIARHLVRAIRSFRE
ncbi:MAG: hypothetical protein GVY14_03645 [Spirochaetes bacterium]|jgi:hypothetical protein|nr:hypothetical protein [Spirochaetota bacterium]